MLSLDCETRDVYHYGMELDEREKFAQEALVNQCVAYMHGIKAMKDSAVLDARGPADVPSLLVVRFPIKKGEEDGAIVIGELDDETIMCERVYDIGDFAGDGVQPGTVVGTMLKNFWMSTGAHPYSIGIVADGVSVKRESARDFEDLFGEYKKTLHEIFVEEPLASEWLSESLNVYIVDKYGRLASYNTFYSYPDDQKPPMAKYDDDEPSFEGYIDEKPIEEIKSQRIIMQIALFFAMLEATKLGEMN